MLLWGGVGWVPTAIAPVKAYAGSGGSSPCWSIPATLLDRHRHSLQTSWSRLHWASLCAFCMRQPHPACCCFLLFLLLLLPLQVPDLPEEDPDVRGGGAAYEDRRYRNDGGEEQVC